MPGEDQTSGERNAAVVTTLLQLIVDRDVAGALELFTDDALFEFPFAPPALLNRHEGKAAIERFMRGAMGLTRRTALEDVRVEPLATPNRVVAEFRGDWELTSGRQYRNTYIAIAELQDGRIQHWREFYNPLIVQEAFAPVAP